MTTKKISDLFLIICCTVSELLKYLIFLAKHLIFISLPKGSEINVQFLTVSSRLVPVLAENQPRAQPKPVDDFQPKLSDDFQPILSDDFQPKLSDDFQLIILTVLAENHPTVSAENHPRVSTENHLKRVSAENHPRVFF